jgi:hypothetical protein
VRLECRRERGGAPGRDSQLIDETAVGTIAAGGSTVGAKGEPEPRVVVDLGDGRAHVVGEGGRPALPQGSGQDELDRPVGVAGPRVAAGALVEHVRQGLADNREEVVVAHEQRRRVLAQRVAQQLLQAAMVAPQVP